MKKIISIFAALLVTGSMCAKVYNAVKVTAVQDGGMYIFERNSRVLDASVSDKALQTTDEYRMTALMGKESYVWKLQTKSEGFTIISMSKYTKEPTGHTQLSNASGKTDVTLGNDVPSDWTFAFTGDVALISNAANDNRFLGEVSSGTNEYKAYATSNLNSHGHDFTVYELQESTDPYIAPEIMKVDFGNVERGEAVDDIVLNVLFGNLTDNVTYAGLAAPFSIKGSATVGDTLKLTISADASTIGNYSQTLKLKSEADNKEENVPVSISVKKSASDYDYSHDFTAIPGFTSWSSTYAEHIVTYDDPGDKVTFTNANKQGSNITDMPVTTGKDVIIVLTNTTKSFKEIYFRCKQWLTKNQVLSLSYSTDGGETFTAFDPAITSSDFTIRASDLSNTVNAIKLSFSSSSNQVGIQSVSFDLQDKSATAIDNTALDTKASKRIENGMLIIEHNGVRYNIHGQQIQ